MRIMLLLVSTGCASLDGFLHNPVPCESVSEATCEDKDSDWDRICTPCDEEYDWSADIAWMEETIADGATIRAIAPEAVQDVDVEGSGGAVLDAYFIPAHGEHPENSEVTLVYHHGNYAGIEHYLPRVRMAHEAGFSVFVWDYRGYGKSTPAVVPTAEEWSGDARRVRDAVDEVAPDPERVLLYANSLGAIPAIEMALYRPGCALVTEAGFTSVESLVASNSGVSLPDSMITSGEYNNIEKIEGVAGPLLAMIGDADETFRVEDTRRMVERAAAAAADKELWVLPGVHHGITSIGVPEAGYTDWAEKLDAFLDEVGACR
ncbi:MAG: pimeloyl-ACP methyl ester carboxylesterase [Myxococcota bacterium]|jgi:pimeloyl-ACP methyl ester carboxylesterase